MTKEDFSIISAENHSVKGIRWISAIYKSLLFVIFLGIMGTQIYAAELKLEPKEYISGNPYQFEISDTWTSEGETIISYAVSEEGQIAIAFSNHTIGVFDNDMNFLYQLSFQTYGAYDVSWLGEELLFIEIRSNSAITCDENGMPETFYEIIGPRYSGIVEERVKKQGDYQYFCTNHSGGDNPLVGYGFYTILKRTSSEGEEEILYEADALLDGAFIARLAGFGLMIIGLLPLIGVFAIWILTRRLNKKS